MAFYYKLKQTDPVDVRIAERLITLKAGIRESGIPEKTVESTLLIATWNIREFDSPKWGQRSKDAFYFIAEIISSFDIVAVQEVNENLKALTHVMEILGSWWKYIITDVTKGSRGNCERIAFLYDTRKVTFGGLAGEVVIPPLEKMRKTVASAEQFYRTPFIVGFQAAWFKFAICSVHIVYGDSHPDSPERIKEIEEISNFLASESKDKNAWSKNWILLGDFNIFKATDKTFKAITDAGFIVPDNSRVNSNIGDDKCFDQIAFILEDESYCGLGNCKSGVFNYYKYVFRDKDEDVYSPLIGETYKSKTGTQKSRCYKDWRTYQMSDHLPKWIEVKVDFGVEYLKKKVKAVAPV